MNIDEFMEFDDNYYGHYLGFHTKRTSCLFDYSRQYNEIPWKYAKSVQEDDKISYLQILYALSEIKIPAIIGFGFIGSNLPPAWIIDVDVRYKLRTDSALFPA